MTDAETSELTISDDRDRGRYIVTKDGRFAGYSEYELAPGRITFTHTVVKPEFEGQGIGSRLARHAVDDALSRDLRITPVCPFIRAWLDRHDQYDSNVDRPPHEPTGQ
jgi:predicted GNAT family acetyltransferase